MPMEASLVRQNNSLDLTSPQSLPTVIEKQLMLAAQVFGSAEDSKRLAATIRNFAQGIGDQYARPGGKLVVSVD